MGVPMGRAPPEGPCPWSNGHSHWDWCMYMYWSKDGTWEDPGTPVPMKRNPFQVFLISIVPPPLDFTWPRYLVMDHMKKRQKSIRRLHGWCHGLFISPRQFVSFVLCAAQIKCPGSRTSFSSALLVVRRLPPPPLEYNTVMDFVVWRERGGVEFVHCGEREKGRAKWEV